MAAKHPTAWDRTRPLLLFDGVCNLCDRSVQFVLRHDRNKRICFATQQSEAAATILREHGVEQLLLSTTILLYGGKVYTHSTCALMTLRLMGGWRSAGYAFIIVPRFIRDAVYRWIARNRYRWFGKKEACLIPQPEWRDRFPFDGEEA